jgi:PIN domain nuclease of toxin-antitoxin system
MTSTMAPLLLDTHAAVWFFENIPMSRAATAAIDAAPRDATPLLVSPITAFEVGQLSSRRRIDLSATPHRWFRGLLAVPGVQLADLTPDILIASSYLPGEPPRDPMDRILIATARELAATLVTRDRAIVAYGALGHVSVVEC